MKYSDTFLPLLILAASSFAIVWSLSKLRNPSPAVVTDPPPEVIESGTFVVFNQELRTNEIYFDGATKQVRIKRSERENAQSTEWSLQIQELTASYFLSSISSRYDQELYVSGSYNSNQSTIERWTLEHSPDHDAQGAWIPLEQRRPPRVRRDVLYSGNDYGHIHSVQIEPEGRFLLFIAFPSGMVYRMHLPSKVITPLFDTNAALPGKSIVEIALAQHVTEGRKYLFLTKEASLEIVKQPTSESIIMLNDPSGTGALSAPFVVDYAAWNVGGYNNDANWVHFGQACP